MLVLLAVFFCSNSPTDSMCCKLSQFVLNNCRANDTVQCMVYLPSALPGKKVFLGPLFTQGCLKSCPNATPRTCGVRVQEAIYLMKFS